MSPVFRYLLAAQLAFTAAIVPLAADDLTTNDNGYYSNGEQCYKEECCNSWSLSAEALLLKYCRSAPAYAVIDNAYSRVNSHPLKYNFDPGLRLAASWSPGFCDNKMILEYTLFSTEKSVETPISNARNEVFLSHLSSPDIEDIIKPYTKGALTDTIDLHIIDFLYEAFTIRNCRCIDLSFFGGLRWLYHKDLVYAAFFDDIPETFCSGETKLNAIGLVMRLEADKPLPCNWSLKSKLGVSALCGKFDSSTVYGSKLRGTVVKKTTQIHSDDDQRAFGSIEGAIRLSRDLQLGCRSGTFFLSVEAARYLDLPVASAFPPLTEINYFSDDVTLAGFSAGLCFNF